MTPGRTMYGQPVEWVKGQGVVARWHRYAGDEGHHTVTACGRRIVQSDELMAGWAKDDGTPLEGDMCPRCEKKGAKP